MLLSLIRIKNYVIKTIEEQTLGEETYLTRWRNSWFDEKVWANVARFHGSFDSLSSEPRVSKHVLQECRSRVPSN